MGRAWSDDVKQLLLEEVQDRQAMTAREWFEIRDKMLRDRKTFGDDERDLNGYDAAVLSVFRLLLETDVRIIKHDRLLKHIEGWTCEMHHSTLLAHDALWTISLASCVDTRQLEIIATSWGNKNYPRPGQHYSRSPVVVENLHVPIPEWLDEYTH